MKVVEAVAAFVAYLQDERRSPRGTVRAYRANLGTLAVFATSVGVVDLAAVDLQVLRAWLVSYRDRSAVYRQQMVASARSWMRWAVRRGLIVRSAADLLAMPRVPRRLPKALLSPEDAVRVMLAPPEDTDIGRRDRALLELLWGSGMRASEVCGLDVDAIDLRAGTARVFGKGGKERVVPMTGASVTAVRCWLRVRARWLARASRTPAPAVTSALFIGCVRRTRYTSWELARMVKRYGAALGHPELHPHAFRHMFATHMLDGGADLRELQAMLGHTRISKTQVYLSTSTAKLQTAYRLAIKKGMR